MHIDGRPVYTKLLGFAGMSVWVQHLEVRIGTLPWFKNYLKLQPDVNA